jgi:hypothetical protein
MYAIELLLDERNLAHVLTALALAGIADADPDATPDDRCWWSDGVFVLETPLNKKRLFKQAYRLVMSLKWVAGIGAAKGKVAASAHHGLFVADGFTGCNPLLDYKSQGTESSILKTFSGQQSPATPLKRQQEQLQAVDALNDWLFQEARGVASWKFDAAIGSHAYDLGFGSNDDQTGDRDPFYPAIELLSIAGVAFFAAPQAWMRANEKAGEEMAYSVWKTPVFLPLAPLAAAGLVDGIDAHAYTLARRANTYGKGAAYRHFPRAASY